MVRNVHRYRHHGDHPRCDHVCFLLGAAEAMATAEDFRCSMCGGPAPDKDRDGTMTAKPGWLGVYFLLCGMCCSDDGGPEP